MEIKVIVNGKPHYVAEQKDLQSLIDDLRIAEKVMAAAVNMEIVKKERWSEHRLREGDRIELLHFVGGG
ncbi:sulfur carrier protein ThiS [Nitratifractor sp.]